MATSPHTHNYLYGKGELLFKATGSGGYEHLGNAPAFSLSLNEEKLEHFSSMSGTKKKDLQLVTQKGASVTFSLEEFSVGNIARAFKSAAQGASLQSAGHIAGQAITVQPGLYVPLGKRNLSLLELRFVKNTGSTALTVGATLTGVTSSATAVVGWVGEGLVECVEATGTFKAGEALKVGSVDVAKLVAAVVRKDVLVVDAATPTVRYKQGVDYDLNTTAGLFRARPAAEKGTITTTAFVSAAYGLSDVQVVQGLTASEVVGELLFVGQPDQGPTLLVNCWKVALSISGEVGLIGEELATLPMSGELLADDENHPESPFFTLNYQE
ncbi:MAG: hypothetical protein RR014_05635 [Bilophila sp.]